MKQENGKLRGWVAGLMLVALAPFAQAELVLNGGFEDDYVVGPHNHWIQSGGSDLGTLAHGGVQSAAFAYDVGMSSKLSQSLSLTGGAIYNIEFWVNLVDADGFAAELDGQDLVTLLTVGPVDATGWTRYFGDLKAVSTGSSTLAFAYDGAAKAGCFRPNRDDCTLYIDDVSVAASVVAPPPPTSVPEPGTLLLVGAALAAGAMVRRKKQA